MKFLLISIGNARTLSFGTKGYDGVIGVAGWGRKGEEQYPYQESEFEKVFSLNSMKVKEIISVNGLDFYDVCERVINKIDSLRKQDPTVKFDLEVSGGYKIVGHALRTVASLRSSFIENIFFVQFDRKYQKLPIIRVKLTKKEEEIFYEFSRLNRPIRKLSLSPLLLNYSGEKTYVYRVLRKCRKFGLLEERRHELSDLGRLYCRFGSR